MNCPQCHIQIEAGSMFCDNCGAKITPIQPIPASPVSPIGGPNCPECGSAVVAGQAYCDECGMSLPDLNPPAPAPAPLNLDKKPPLPVTESSSDFSEAKPTDVGSAKTIIYSTPPAPLSPPQPAKPRVVLHSSRVELEFGNQSELLIGREDPISGVFPQLDMTSHGGVEGGISRQHARILKQGTGWAIEDLNSTNYTFVNRQRLTPRQQHPLNDGDEIRLGKVVLTFRAT